MHFGACILLAAAVFVSFGDSSDETSDLEFSATLAEDIRLQWGYDKEQITLKLQAPTKGWIGVGFSHTGSMNGADLIMMGVLNGSPYALDTHAERNGLPLVDASQDIKTLGGWENGTHTSVTIARKRVTCDSEDREIMQGTHRVIWAFGKNDLIDNSLSSLNYHETNRGSLSLKLLNRRNLGRILPKKKEENLQYFDIVATNFTMPPIRSHYLCQMFKVPEGGKRHIVKSEFISSPEKEKFVHHIVVLLCDDPSEEIFQFARQPHICYEETSSYEKLCRKVMTGWAVGQGAMELPSDTGLPVGGPDDFAFIVLQTHYDNPDLLEFPDTSGIRFYYTEILRENEAGIFLVAQSNPSIWIPPGAAKFRTRSHCSETCISKGLSTSGLDEVTVIGTVLHTHLAGRSVRLRHIRNGSELEPIARDDFYDFDYQEIQYVAHGNVKIRRGDTLLMQCDYGSLDRKEMTIGGLSTTDEMCRAFVMYYPKTKLDICDSATMFIRDPVKTTQLMKELDITIPPTDFPKLVTQISESYEMVGEILKPYFDKVDWTPEKIKFAEKFFDGLPPHPICLSGSDFLMNYNATKDFPEFTEFEDRDGCSEHSYEDSISPKAAYLVLVIAIIMLAGKVNFS